MKTKNIEEALHNLRPNLASFLVEHEIIEKASDYFCCINPQHEDADPSSHILPDGLKGYCHGCGATFDILTANYWLNKAPISGFTFISENLMPLCEKYEVAFTIGDLTEEDKFIIDSYRVCRLVSDYIVTREWPQDLLEYIEGRGLTVEYCKTNGIGIITDYDAFFGYLRERYTLAFLREVGFTRASLFNSKNILFTLRDSNGAPVGFAARNTKWEEEYGAYVDKGKIGTPPIKYNTTSADNRIYRKAELLYGFDQYLRVREESDPLYLFEGQFDRDLLSFLGLYNCASLCGTALTSGHLNSLRKNKVSHLILALDGDNAGRKQISSLLLGRGEDPGILASMIGFKVSVLEFPDGYDPNSYVNEYGIEEFSKLKLKTSFEWVLHSQDLTQDPLQTCEVMIPFILKEENHLVRESMTRVLSEATGHSMKAIEEELIRREDSALAKVSLEKRRIAEDALRQIQYSGELGEDLLRSALQKIEELDKITGKDPLSIEETVSALDSQMEEEASLEGPSGFTFKMLGHFQDALNGPCEGTVIGLGGVANTGKSALQSQVAKEIVECNEDSIVILHTIDDNRLQMNRRLAIQFAYDEALRIGSETVLTLNKIANPKYWIDPHTHLDENRDLVSLRDFGYKKLRDYMLSGRLHVKDMTHGITLDLLERMVRKAREDYPDKSIVVILDNFHKTGGFGNLDERSAVKRKSSMLKTGIAQTYGITVFSTFEYKKIETGKRPSNSDLRDAVNIEYDLNYIEHLFSPLKTAKDIGKEEECTMWHGHPFAKMPIIEGDVGKNKITEFTGRHHYKFFPAQSRYECVTPEEAFSISEMHRMESSILDEDERRDWVWKNGKRVNLVLPEADKKIVKVKENDIPF